MFENKKNFGAQKYSTLFCLLIKKKRWETSMVQNDIQRRKNASFQCLKWASQSDREQNERESWLINES